MRTDITLFEAPCPECKTGNDVAVHAGEKVVVHCDDCREVFEVNSDGRISTPRNDDKRWYHAINEGNEAGA